MARVRFADNRYSPGSAGILPAARPRQRPPGSAGILPAENWKFIFSFLSFLLNWRFCQLSFLRYAQPRKRLAARGFARARRAVGGFACEPASALGRASAMRCIAANRHGSPLRGTRNFTERPHVCLRPGLKAPFRPFSVGFGVGRSPLLWSREAPSPRTLCVSIIFCVCKKILTQPPRMGYHAYDAIGLFLG